MYGTVQLVGVSCRWSDFRLLYILYNSARRTLQDTSFPVRHPTVIEVGIMYGT